MRLWRIRTSPRLASLTSPTIVDVVITVYVLEGARKRYVGITANLQRRLTEHRSGSHSASLIGKFSLLHTETFPDYVSARVRERFLKSGKGREWLNEKYPKRL